MQDADLRSSKTVPTHTTFHFRGELHDKHSWLGPGSPGRSPSLWCLSLNHPGWCSQPAQSGPTVPSRPPMVYNQVHLLADLGSSSSISPSFFSGCASHFQPSPFSLLRSFSSFCDLSEPPRLSPARLQRTISGRLKPHDSGCSFGRYGV